MVLCTREPSRKQKRGQAGREEVNKWIIAQDVRCGDEGGVGRQPMSGGDEAVDWPEFERFCRGALERGGQSGTGALLPQVEGRLTSSLLLPPPSTRPTTLPQGTRSLWE